MMLMMMMLMMNAEEEATGGGDGGGGEQEEEEEDDDDDEDEDDEDEDDDDGSGDDDDDDGDLGLDAPLGSSLILCSFSGTLCSYTERGHPGVARLYGIYAMAGPPGKNPLRKVHLCLGCNDAL